MSTPRRNNEFFPLIDNCYFFLIFVVTVSANAASLSNFEFKVVRPPRPLVLSRAGKRPTFDSITAEKTYQTHLGM